MEMISHHGTGKQEQLVQALQQVQEQDKAYSYSVNTTAGFSIVKYKGNATNGHQIPHHLGVAPSH